MKLQDLRSYVKSDDAYPVVGATLSHMNTFDAYHADRECLIAGVITSKPTDADLQKARELAAKKEAANGGVTFVIPCVIAPYQELKLTASADKDNAVLIILVNIMWIEGEAYAMDAEMMV